MATIVHFGISDCARLRVLSAKGFEVLDCGDSLPKLEDALQLHRPDAVLFTGSDSQRWVVQACSLSSSLSPAPRILFSDTFVGFRSHDFDAVVEPLTPPEEWLQLIDKTIQQTRTVLSQSRATQEESRQLRADSVEVRRESREQQARLRKLRSKDHDGNS